MDVGKLVWNSVKYPFRNIRKLPILFILFFLATLIPAGMIFDNRYVTAFGVIAFFIFIMVVPGYLFSMIDIGLHESSVFPSFNFAKDIYNSIRLIVLRIVYMIVPALVFFIVLSTLGVSSVDMIKNIDIARFLLTVGFIFVAVVVTYLIFEFLLFFAKARLAYLDSLPEALNMYKVIIDIKTIGIFNIIKWILFIIVLLVIVSAISSWIISIPYVGYLIYFCIVIPMLESIANYSLGLLYSNISKNEIVRY